MAQTQNKLSRLSSAKKKVLFDLLRKKRPSPILPVPRDRDLPLSFAQQRLWFLDRLAPDNPFYNMFGAVRLTGVLDLDALRGAFREIVRRHEALRTTFQPGEHGPVQVIAPPPVFDVPLVDLEGLAEEPRRRELARLSGDEAQRPFNLARGPLVRAALLRIAAREHTLLVNLHHIISDGWSMGILVHELASLYGAFGQGARSPLPELPIQYADFAVWQRERLSGERLDAELDFWRRQLAGIPESLELPFDHPRPAVESFRGTNEPFAPPVELSRALAALTRRRDATQSMTLLAGFASLLGRLARQEDVAVGLAIANRPRREVEGLIGFFVNTLVVRTDLSEMQGFAQLVGEVRETALAAYAHQDLPFERLVEELQPERNLSRNPLIQVMFGYQNFPRAEAEVRGLTLSLPDEGKVAGGTAKFDLTLFLFEDGDRLQGTLEYNSEIFEAATMRRLLRSFESLLAAAVADPETPVALLPLLGAAERHQLTIEWNDSASAYPAGASLQELFAEQVRRTPDAPAVMAGPTVLSYRDLDRRANGLARELRRRGAGPGSRVGLCLERSADMVVAVLAIIQAGAAYVPLDPEYPAERLALMMEDCDLRWVVVDEAGRALLPDSVLAGREILTPEEETAEQADFPPLPVEGGAPSEDTEGGQGGEALAYVIYTSGSTGRPKGVAVPHRAVVRLVRETNYLHLGPGDRVAQVANISFDAATYEIWGALLNGAAVVVIPRDIVLSPPDFAASLREQRITSMFLTSALFSRMAQEAPDAFAGMRELLVGGEAVEPAAARRVLAGRPPQRLLNGYGPTESTTFASWYPIRTVPPGSLPIGSPIANTTLHVTDRWQSPVPLGAAGELAIGGDGLAWGYWRRPELSAERFVPDPEGPAGSRLYRTGDLVRRRADGAIEFLGRLDHQVKIRGFRIELGEIEARLEEHPAVLQTVVLAREDVPGDRRLAAYVVQNPAYETAESGEQTEQVSQWGEFFDDLYQDEAVEADPTFNIIGWNSTYTGLPLPASEMEEWLDDTIGRIAGLAPRQVLEIGCGTGMILFRIAPRCEIYTGTDVSGRALRSIESQLGRVDLDDGRVQLLRASAHQLGGLADDSFDTVVVNSVAQYFPSGDYLAEVVERAVELVRPGGAVFLGDLRSLPLLEAFHTSLELFQADPETPLARLRQRVHARHLDENELVIDPAFFTALRDRLPKLGRIEIHPKHGRAHNELTGFRYQVVLRIGTGREEPVQDGVLDWRSEGLTLAALRRRLAEDAPPVLRLRNIPNARTAEAAAAARLLQEAPEGIETAADLRRRAAEAALGAVEPQDVWDLANDLPYEVELSWADPGADGSFEAVLWSSPVSPLPAGWEGAGRGAGGEGPYTNNPLQGRFLRRIVPELRAFLQERLPDYMMPSAFVLLDALPLTPNGKVDRRRLPAPGGAPESGRSLVAPRTPVEETLARLFAEVLGEERAGDRIGIHDHFFELGGHSLAATRLASRVRAALGVELPLRAIFEAPTVAELALRCAAPAGVESSIPLAARPRDPQGDPLSFTQERFWFLERLTPGTSTYNLPSRMRLRGPLDRARLDRCFTEICRRHETLRTRFELHGNVSNQTPVQVVAPPAPQVLSLVDLTALPEDRRLREAEHQAGEEADQPFDLERGPLLRAILVRIGAEEHAVLLNLHHIITDGWSMGILFGEVAALYQAFADGRPSPLPELPVQYADVARWQRDVLAGPALQEQLAWWRRHLDGAPPSLDLPLDRVRPAVQTFLGASVSGRFPAELTGGLRALAHREGASLFMVLLAGFGLLASRLSGQSDVVVGSPVAGRGRPELESLIGCFLNTLALRLDLGNPAEGGLTGRRLLGRAREAALGAYAHQDVPFERLLEDLQPERDLSRTPLFQIFLNMLNFPASASRMPDGLVLEPLGGTGVDSKFDLTLYAAEDADGIGLSLVYNADLLDGPRVEEMVRQLQLVLEQIAADPDAPVEGFSLLTPEAAAVLPDPREPLGDAWVGGVHELFAEQAQLHPERPAVADSEVAWSYGELAEAAARLAGHLRAAGLEPQEPVAIWAHRGARTVQAVFGTLWAGGAFVLLDPAYPPARLAETVEMAEPRYWLDIAAAGAPPAEVEEVLQRLNLRGRLRLPCEISSPPVEPAQVGPDDAVAIAFTSGSTGAPKGIVQRHGSMSHFLPWIAERFGVGPEDRFSLLSGLSHDPFQRDLFTSLCLGASLCAPTGEEMATPGRLAVWMARERVTVSNLTPAMAQLLTETGSEPLPHLRATFLIGDALTRADIERLRRLAPGAVCVNLYGTTETQRALGMHLVTREEIEDPRAPQVLPLGRGMRDVQLLVVAGDRLAGIGELGEIQVRSPHLACGYLDGERFGDLYRTGDLGRYRPAGEVVFAGRADQQVKIRGFRIEPAEVEAALGRLPGVREAVVLPREIPGDRELVAYVAGEEIEPARLREALRSRLPGYMVPSAFVLLDELPVTPNGKVDRRSLSQIGARIEPERGGDRGDGFAAPRTPAEETLAALWVEVLGPQRTGGRVGVRDHFFGLGGHSLLATRLLAAIQDAFGVELPLRIVFERPTLEEMAAAIAEAGETATRDEPVVRLQRAPGINRFPVSFSQLREWILDQLEPGNPAYNIPNNLRIGGPLSIPVLAEALHRLVQRHEVFRTAFVAGLDEEENEEPLQVVLPEVSLEVPVIDLSALPEALREAELPRQVRHHAGTGFDLTAPPLLRVRVIRLAAADHALLMTVHHIISDGWSMGILNQELAALYEAVAAGAESALSPLPVQYADYAVWQRRRLDAEALERQVGYWRRQLTGAPPLLELPTDRPRPPVRSSRGRRIPFLLPQPLAGRLEELALRHGATLFMVLLAGYQTLLARWSGQDEVVAGTYSGNRPRRELEPLIGFFINTLVLRTDLSGDPSFSVLLGRVRETTLGAYAHRDVPFEKLLETLQLPRDPSRTPLFQALLVLHNFPPAQADLSTGVRLAPLPVAAEKSDYDLSLWLGETPQGVGGMLEYSTDLFDEPTLVRFAGQLRLLLEGAAADPDRNVWTLPLISEEEQERQLAAWSQGPAVPEGPPLLHRLVEEQAARTPTAVAVEAGDVRLTYADLVEQARRVAEGIEPGTIVALAAERTPELIVQMLAVLQAGAAYLPIDPTYPAERRQFMLEDSGAKDLKDPKDSKDKSQVSPAAPAYLIYTSGSTGLPKGVVVPHRAIASFVRAARETYEIGPGDRVLQLTSISFDTSAEEIWPTLASGATLVLRPDDMMASIPHFLREIERLGITYVDLPTAFWHEMIAGMEAEDLELPRGLRLVILGGEEALADRFALWHRRVGSSVRLVNTYGPTEATIVATRHELAGLAPGGTVPIGQPIPGARTYVLDRFFTPVPPGVRGELWIGGAGVARGYLGRPDLTAERFRPDPFSDPSDRTDHPTDRSDRSDRSDAFGARLYRTGDLAVLTPDGDLIFAGRADRQLKIRGYRVEPGEIEAALRLHPALRDAVVDVRGARADQRLIAWIVPHEGIEAPGASDLRAFLRDRLPEPLLPAAFVPVTALPLTPSGKVDRRGLPEPAEARPEGATYVEPQSALERTIAEIYRDLLRVGRVGLHDNFFDLGGHSLLIVRAHQKLREALGKEIPVLDLFRFPTVAALARHLGGEETGSLQKVQGFAEQQRAAQQRQKAAMERLRRPGRTKEQR